MTYDTLEGRDRHSSNKMEHKTSQYQVKEIGGALVKEKKNLTSSLLPREMHYRDRGHFRAVGR